MRSNSTLASRCASPVRFTASAMISPPSTSHSVAEANPEKTTWAGATASTIASMKNKRPTICSGSDPAAHSPTVNTTSAAACDHFHGHAGGRRSEVNSDRRKDDNQGE